MTHHAHANKPAFRLLAGWCGLLLYVGALSPIGMGVGTLLGTMDRDHHAILQPGADGMRLVLHHVGHGAGHQHGLAARALTVFAQPASATDPDHVLQFSSTSSFTRDSQFIVPAANSSVTSAIIFAEPVSSTAISHNQFVAPPRPPPGSNGNFLGLRSTVLLI